MKVALQDKKAMGAFLAHQAYEGRVLISNGSELRATWGAKPLVARWDSDKVVLAPSEDKGVRRAQELLLGLGS